MMILDNGKTIIEDQYDKRYLELLVKYSNDNELLELINLTILDNEREKENYYIVNHKYSNDRCLLSKLKMDLKVTNLKINSVK